MQTSVIVIWTPPLMIIGMRTFEADRRHLDCDAKREAHVWVRMQHLHENGSADLVSLAQCSQKSAYPICRRKPQGAGKRSDLKSDVIYVV